MALAYGRNSSPGSSLCIKGSAKVNIRAMAADERMEYTTVLMLICVSSRFQLLCCCVCSWLIDKWFIDTISFLGRCRSSLLYAGVARRIIYGVRNVVVTDTATTTG